MSGNQEPFTLIVTPLYKTGNTDQFTLVATEMALVHNCIVRALNEIYRQALTVQAKDYKSFCQYISAFCEGLDAHHRGEEEIAFPAIEKATKTEGVMEANLAQHEAFHSGLMSLESYLTKILDGDISSFSGARLREIMDSFSAPLNQHLHDEIETLLNLTPYGDSIDLKHIVKEEAEKVLGTLSKASVLPTFLLNHDINYEDGIHDFPPIPAPVNWVFMHVLTWWNWSWWKFTSCDSYGHMKA